LSGKWKEGNKETMEESLKSYLIISNISKRNNVIQLINVARVYNFVPILVAAPRIKESLPECLLSELLWFPDLKEVQAFMESRSVPIIAIEILAESKSVLDFQFPTSVALMPGNEGTGLNAMQRQIATEFVYIPHYGEGTASLNVHVATSVILYHHMTQSMNS
jgi:tRNA G18 (ribose-2'-O)-methylase SpoU